MNIDGIADFDADERRGNLAVEGPVAERRSLRQSAFDLDAEQIDANGLRFSLADRRRQVCGLARNVCLDQRLRRRARGDDELALHAGELMSGYATEIDEVTGLGRAKRDRRACAFAGDSR